jgi:hypothetical protein
MIQYIVSEIWLILKTNFTRNSSACHQEKRRKEKKPKPEEHEGMPQRLHYPLEKRRDDRNPECHDEQQKDVA